MKNLKNTNLTLIITGSLLLLLGALILASTSTVFSMERFGDQNYLLKHQLLSGLLPGLFLGLLGFLIPLPIIKKFSFWVFLLTILSLCLLFVPTTELKLFNASSWINLGIISFQPSEFLKLALILYLGAWLTKQNSRKSLLPFLMVMGIVSLLLILQPDIGTLVIVAMIGLAIFFATNTPLWQNFLIWLSGLAALGILIKLAPYRMSRWRVFINPDLDPMGIGYQLKQSLISIGSGGIFGLGLGGSRQRFNFLPATIGDAIFSIFAEETGFFGAVILLLLIFIFVWQGFKIAQASKDKFSQIVAVGICFWIGFQSLVNICSMTGIFPLTGVPLPFISYGGSHLTSELAALGILLNISRQT
ncbi:FtsW/RodA/SpoVE family cell cycle protein [Candidatus Parcubacteria bacterium]|nr:FtsW/RodA/SpoVE family cell cycle protein [Patescibacteria group bacterium]MCG2688549.1 FtsW/RodA/SpoVE family cell cycle protein [Candidatus Parcubacteria bacterium]